MHFWLLLFLIVSSNAEDRIYNGTRVVEDDLMHTVKMNMVLRSKKSRSYESFCSGTIISEHYVLTAAHCLQDASYVGFVTRHKFSPEYFAHDWIIHPGYNRTTLENDIAIARFHQNGPVLPSVLLAANYTHKKDEWLRVAGFGMTKYEFKGKEPAATDPAETLMETYLRGQNRNDCPELFSKSFKIYGICMFRNDSTILGGDSGGPVFAKNVATEVSHYCPWIEETTANEVKCQTFEPTTIIPK
uniref:Peptidase S1 domain-containing protein n=1 Tax=Panagrolaimus sp. JU765 TaxID=591449 RepID=A0AC34QMS6_9BILA